MEHLRADRQLAGWVLIVCVLLTAVFSALAWRSGLAAVSRENGPMENTQLVGLAMAILAFAAVAVRTRDAERMVATGMAVLCMIFLWRELDFRSFGPRSWMAFFHTRTFKLAFGAAITAGMTIYWLRRRDLLPTVFRYSFSRQSWPLWLGGFLLIVGEASEYIAKKHYHHAIFVFLEELAENWGFAALLMAAVWFLRNTSQRT